ncbi:hypothetical protein OEW28_09040 [Defluviimonas sp. WL0002]|uniref:Glycosyl transferase family 2 n=1 Tax=Albidovulum marisflavi TaxID=2984159 RepID=A0ABT2ZDE5_9RHOB|nr:glycosyltransferase family 2 protein [Defluviimonas sp. WL0002]MCV2868771.1 hypothetical protein [Defluviimonas sp. WL0002]
MTVQPLSHFLTQNRALLAKGPVALIFVEDEVELSSTLRHHLAAGFRPVLAFLPDGIDLPEEFAHSVHAIRHDARAEGAVTNAVNALLETAPHTTWFYYCYNGEYLFHPFAKTRSVAEMLTFHTEERRSAMFCTVVDLYAGDLGRAPSGVSVDDAMLDAAGYYALARWDEQAGAEKERQIDLFGGLKWRFEEHIPWTRRRIDRIALFRAEPGLKLLPDHRLSIEELNTYACPWHNNVTAAIASFRTAKALRRNPASKHAVNSFVWSRSTRFEWSSQQLMDLGLMEPGQWF